MISTPGYLADKLFTRMDKKGRQKNSLPLAIGP